jgi:hypothetical protein
MAQRTSLNRPYGRQHEDDLVRDITELYEGQTSIIPYKVYTAYITQNGTDAPVLTGVRNDTGRTFTPQYVDVATYTLVYTGDSFELEDIQIIFTPNSDERRKMTISYLNTSGEIFIYTQSVGANGDLSYNDSLLRGWIEIRVYN